MKSIIAKAIFAITVAAFCHNPLIAQKKQVVFLEPNLSVTYDTAALKIKERGIITPKDDGYVVLRYKPQKTEVRIEASPASAATFNGSGKPATSAQLKKYLQKQIDGTKKDIQLAGTHTLIDFDKKPVSLGAYQCYGTVQKSKTSASKITQIVAYRLSSNDFTRISLRSWEDLSLKQHYELLRPILLGTQALSASTISTLDAAAKNKYKVLVEPAQHKVPALQNRKGQHMLLKVQPKMTDEIRSVYVLDNPYAEEFKPEANGDVFLVAHAPKKGLIKKEGYLLWVSSIGKEYKVPFSFTFENN